MNVLIFGGTTEGRNLCSFLLEKGAKVTLSVATDYGKKLILPQENLVINAKRMNEGEIAAFLKENSFDYVVDTTHPYADIATKNIKAACGAVNAKYMRLTREVSDCASLTLVKTAEEAARLLEI